MSEDNSPVRATSYLRRHNRDEFLAAVAVWIAAALVIGTLVWILIDIAVRGMSQISLSFLTEGVEDAGRAGGIGPVILSTALILLVTLAIAIPLSLATAIALTERIGQVTCSSRPGKQVRLFEHNGTKV